MSGKGHGRRPKGISEEELEARWEKSFGRPKRRGIRHQQKPADPYGMLIEELELVADEAGLTLEDE